MRPAPAILLAALTTATLLPFGQQPAAASCAAPYLTDTDHLVLHHGASAEIDGAAFANGCQDTGSCSADATRNGWRQPRTTAGAE